MADKIDVSAYRNLRVVDSSTNMNDYRDGGVVVVTDAINSPGAGSFIYTVYQTVVGGVSLCTQEAIDLSAGTVYRRTRSHLGDWSVWTANGGGGGVSDHGALTGLADDDHPQYFDTTRGDARYSLTGHNHTGIYDPAGTAATGDAAHVAALDPHPQYLTQAEGDVRYPTYTLPVASGTVLGGVKSSASITVAGDGTLGIGATVTGPTGSLLTIASAAGQDITLSPSNGSLTVINASILLSAARQLRWASDTFLSRRTTAVLQCGLDSATPVAQTFVGASSRGGTDTNVVGGTLILRSGAGTGNAAAPLFAIETSDPTASGTTQQSYVRRVTVQGANVGIGSGASSPSTTLHVAGPIRCAAYTVATVPSAASVGNGSHIYVTNPTAGVARPYWSNGTEWRDAAGTLLA